ncbi:6-carboxytetrahydropterin synthase [Actinocorallia sp. A-T 12471]|uniref:6-pyruvoyl trahydropterin synthase family protein n=1 Tax=Actinocorallia sp. A-T 12471 TaxID=3089813 RepID=UPI0029CE4B0C|nr:6-carboxytetrahydropterin synthase [Actinocorallia sp. A-T 12471]MDX6740243.1 6-carboxytetrahydropterin synthase [Actinocorallia sp. A-T 12471]
MLSITKDFHFSASHVLDTLPEWHPCARMHGHNYIVRLELSAPREALDANGFVRDYRDLDPFKIWLDKTLDHQHLNEQMSDGGRAPSAENLALWIYDQWKDHYPELTAVSVSETPKTWTTYRP